MHSATQLHQCSVMMRCLAEWSKITRGRAPHRQEVARQAKAAFFKHQQLMMTWTWEAWCAFHAQRKIEHWASARAASHYQRNVLALALTSWKVGVHAVALHRRAVHVALQHWCRSRLRSCMTSWHAWVAHATWEQCVFTLLMRGCHEADWRDSVCLAVQVCNGKGSAT